MKKNNLIHGIDVTSINRPEFLNPNLYIKVLHDQEILQWQKMETTEQTLYVAKLWAIKEAIFKALPQKLPLKKMYIEHLDHQYIYNHTTYDFIISLSMENVLVFASVIGVLKIK